jgi:hypothetical protein
MPTELGHKSMTKTHDLIVGFTLGVKIRTAFPTSHRKGGKAVLKDLFKSEEFENTGIYGRVEAKSSLVGTYGRIHLDPVTPVYVDLPFVIHPGNPEGYQAFRLHHAKQDILAVVNIVLGNIGDGGLSHLLNSL